MLRRGNKSKKVPNVKLRPAEKGSVARILAEPSICWAQETQPGSDDTNIGDLCPRPFKGFVICATGDMDKNTLFKQAVELGATHALAFTDRVTHLIAVEHGGAKYKCALERKIPIVKPSWVSGNFEIWRRGDDVDVVESINEHRLPIFTDIVVCPSGITDITRRTQISKIITQHQGTYMAKLERPVRVTHLLCSGDDETDKMKLADKFNTKGEARIHLVWEEWFWDSLEFGGRFDEERYHVRQPRPERRSVHETATPPPASSEVGSQHDEPMSSVSRTKLLPKAARNDNSDDLDEELAVTKVVPDLTIKLWGGLLERRGYQVSNGQVLLSPSKAKVDVDANRLPRLVPPSPVKKPVPAGAGVIAQFRRANSFAPTDERTSSKKLPFRRATTLGNANANAKAGPSNINKEPAKSPTTTTRPDGSPAPEKIFNGMSFRLLGEAKTAVVRNAIDGLGGRVSYDEDEDVTFIVVRLVSGSKFFLQEEDEHERRKFRTECWLEHSIYEERICSPDEHISFVPVAIPIPIKGAENVRMSISGFNEAQAMAIKRLFLALGIETPPLFNTSNTHLLCPSGKGLKFDKAKEWGIPVVGMGWLKAMKESGRVPGVKRYIVNGPPEGGEEEDGGWVVPMEVDGADKGKGRADGADAAVDGEFEDPNSMEVDTTSNVQGKMLDITNCPPAPQPMPFAQNLDMNLLPPSTPKKQKSLYQQPQAQVQPQVKHQVQPPQAQSQPQPTSQRSQRLQSQQHPARQQSILRSPTTPLSPTYSQLRDAESLASFLEKQPYQSSLPDSPSESVELERERERAKRFTESMYLGDEPGVREGKGKNKLEAQPTELTLDDDSQPRHDHQDVEAPRESIPSSTSPSPMKPHPNGSPSQNQHSHSLSRKSSSRLSLSPVKFDMGATKMLQNNITSLLGKRAAPDDLPDTSGGGHDDHVPAAQMEEDIGNKRGGKRLRPQRSSKLQSRKTSDSNISESAKTAQPPAAASTSKRPSPKPRGAAAAGASRTTTTRTTRATSGKSRTANGSQSRIGSQDEESQAAESLRVMYEDPAQFAEQRRLMELLKTTAGGKGADPETLTLSGSSTSSNANGRGLGRRKSARLPVV